MNNYIKLIYSIVLLISSCGPLEIDQEACEPIYRWQWFGKALYGDCNHNLLLQHTNYINLSLNPNPLFIDAEDKCGLGAIQYYGHSDFDHDICSGFSKTHCIYSDGHEASFEVNYYINGNSNIDGTIIINIRNTTFPDCQASIPFIGTRI